MLRLPTRVFLVASLAAQLVPAQSLVGVAPVSSRVAALAPQAGLDLDNISITVTEYPTGEFQFRLDAEGMLITAVTATPPVGAPIPLTCVGTPFADCNYEESFPDLASLQAKFPPGSYLFTFNGGSSSISLVHAGYVSPGGFVDVAYSPSFPAGTTSPTPTFSWNCPTGCSSAESIGLELEDAGGEVFAAGYAPPSAGVITLPMGPFVPFPSSLDGGFGALLPGQAYLLRSVIEVYSSSSVTMGASDVLGYEDASKREKEVEFTVAPFVNLGSGLSGVTGTPVLIGGGPLLPGSSGILTLSNAAPSALSVLFISFSSAPTPFKCGTLVPTPAVLQASVFTNGAGSMTIPWASWPASLSGFDIYFQYAIKDAAAVCGVALSNALRADVP